MKLNSPQRSWPVHASVVWLAFTCWWSLSPQRLLEGSAQPAAMGVTDNTASLVKGPKEAYLVLAEKGRDSLRFVDV